MGVSDTKKIKYYNFTRPSGLLSGFALIIKIKWIVKFILFNKMPIRHLLKFLYSFEENVPIQDTIITKSHKVFARGKFTITKKFRRAEEYVNDSTIKIKKIIGKLHLYNVLFKKYRTMTVNGLLCETLHPKRVIQHKQRTKQDMEFVKLN